jgi:hypothetical protein
MLVLIVLGEQETFCLLDCSIERKPASVLGMNNAVLVNAGTDQPFPDGIYCLLGRGKGLVYIICGPIFAVEGRFRVRTAID